MIHIAIPSHRTVIDPDDALNKYTVFDIHVNGAYHASVRYNALYSLHERLVATFGFRLNAPEFPPKKIWKLDAKSLNERRDGLTRYLQGVISNPDVSRHVILERTFLEFQVRFYSPPNRYVKLNVLLPDGRPVFVECCAEDPTCAVIKKFCQAITMRESNAKHFGLFLARSRQDKIADKQSGFNPILFDMLCVRWLRDFESPFISQQLANQAADGQEPLYKIIIHRVTWDPSVEEPMLDDTGALKILYLQALNDIQKGLLNPSQDIKRKLTSLQEFGDFKQFFRLCHTQPDYGYEWLAPVCSDFPEKGTICELKVGRRQLILEYRDKEGIVHKSMLPSKRIRIWRVSYTESQPNSEMTFQLEYLIRRNEFTLITLHTEPAHAVLLSLFLQSIADEILQSQEKTNGIESLEVSKPDSLLTDNLSSKSSMTNGTSIMGDKNCINGFNNNNNNKDSVLKLISHQMPFYESETFVDVTDADL